MPADHSNFFSPSSGARLLTCPGSAKASEGIPEQISLFANEGTDAHELAEIRLKERFGIKCDSKVEDLTWYSQEMEDYIEGYVNYVFEKFQEAKESAPDPVLLIEQKVSAERYHESLYGTTDVSLISDKTLTIVDLKYGKGVRVDSKENVQEMIYAICCLETFGNLSFLGYDKIDGEIRINEEQAKIVKLIYRMYLIEGKTRRAIADYLNENEVPTPSGKGKAWTINNINSILTNEKYKGDALLQKTYIADFLEHKPVKNNGEVAQAYVENNHPAIIQKEDWELVQAELKKRDKIGASYSSNTVFSSKIKCECCGSYYGRKVWHKGSPYEKLIYRCNRKYDKNHSTCKTPHFTEDEIKSKFIEAYNEAMSDKQRIIDDTKEVITILSDTSEIDKRIADANIQIDVTAGLVEKLVRENANVSQDQEEYESKYNALASRFDEAKIILKESEEERLQKTARKKELEAILQKMIEADTVLLEWSDELWLTLIDECVAHEDKTISFKFKNGYEITK